MSTEQTLHSDLALKVLDPTLDDPELLFRSFLNEREVTGRTAVFIAVEVNRPKCLETLLAFRADPNIPNLKNITPLQLACERGFQTCIRVLIRNHASCRTTHGKNLVELIWESVRNLDERAELLAYLIANGAQCPIQRLEGLIQTLPLTYQETFNKAISEASVLLQDSIQDPTNALHLKAAMTRNARDIVNTVAVDSFGMSLVAPIGSRNDENLNNVNNPSTTATRDAMIRELEHERKDQLAE